MSDQAKVVPLRELQRDKDIARSDAVAGPSPCNDKQLSELADMSPVQYGQRRGALAKALGTSLAFLDQEYHERRKRADGREAEVGDSFLQDPDPWLEPVDVADLLNVLCETAKSHLVLPDGAAERSPFGFCFPTRMTASTFRQYLASRAPRRNAARQRF